MTLTGLLVIAAALGLTVGYVLGRFHGDEARPA